MSFKRIVVLAVDQRTPSTTGGAIIILAVDAAPSRQTLNEPFPTTILQPRPQLFDIVKPHQIGCYYVSHRSFKTVVHVL